MHKILISVLTAIAIVILGGEIIAMIRLEHQIGVLEKRVDYYRTRYNADSTLIENLKNPRYLERYARENYNMHKPDEEVFIIRK